MKKLLLAFLFILLFSSITLADAPFHIGIITMTNSQSEDNYRAAERFAKEYGLVKDGGMVSLLTFPDNFSAEMETVISQIVSFADDPKTKAIICSPAVEGTTEGFRRVREMRPDILLMGSTPHEDPVMISKVADLSFYSDIISRGYLAAWEAKQMGADTIVYITFPRHMSHALIGRNRDIMKVAAAEFGLKFVNVSAPDPASEVGIAGAQQFVLEKVPAWIEEYGKNAAFMATVQGHQEPLIKRVLEGKAFFMEDMNPSPSIGWPGALGIKFEEEDRGNYPRILKKVEEAVVKSGNPGRMATWAYGSIYPYCLGLAEHAKNVIEGKSKLSDKQAIMEALGKWTPGASWNSSYYVAADGKQLKNYLLCYQDSYVLGKGYLKTTAVVRPEKYYDKNIGKE